MGGYTLLMCPDWSKITTEVLDIGTNEFRWLCVCGFTGLSAPHNNLDV